MSRREFGLLLVAAVASRFLWADDATLYNEKYRPQFHFTPQKGGPTIPMA